MLILCLVVIVGLVLLSSFQRYDYRTLKKGYDKIFDEVVTLRDKYVDLRVNGVEIKIGNFYKIKVSETPPRDPYIGNIYYPVYKEYLVTKLAQVKEITVTQSGKFIIEFETETGEKLNLDRFDLYNPSIYSVSSRHDMILPLSKEEFEKAKAEHVLEQKLKQLESSFAEKQKELEEKCCKKSKRDKK